MAVRREKVVLELDDGGFSTQMAKDAAAVMLLERALKSLDGTTVNIHQRLSESAVQVDALTRSTDKSDRSINQLTGRLALLADTFAILGPGLAPIAAVGVPAISGLASALGFATLGAAGFIIAVQGVGDALGAMNTAHLEPTAENLAAARLAMEKLSPAGQALATQLYGLRDEWRRLKDVSQGALFPGLSDALDSLETRLPDFERILVNVNTAVGDMLADGAESLGSERWDDFFTFIATDAPPAIAALGDAIGSLTHGFAELWMATDGLNDSFATWLVDSAADFDQWAQGLAQTEGFQEFVAYVRETGPQVAETLGAVALAVVRIGEAAAPLGGPVLNALEGVADAVGAIAGSDAGPAIMATVTALALLRRGMAGFDRIQATSWVQGIKGAETFGQRVAAVRSPLLKTSAALAGIAIASSDTAQGMGLANAASGALLGTMAGPWGAVVGGAVGLMLDLGKSIGGFEVNADSLTATLNQQTGAITANTTAYAANELEKQGVLKAAQALGLSLADVTRASLGDADALARVNTELEATRSGFYDADGRITISTEKFLDFGESSGKVTDAIGVMSGEVENGQTRIGRMADATDAGTAAYDRATTAAQDFAAAVAKLNSTLSGRAAMRDYEAAIDDFAKSLKENGRSFDINTEKGRNNQAALDNIATTAIRVAENLKGAARQRFLTAAIADLREAGDKFNVPKAQTQALIELLREANKVRVNPKVTVDTSGGEAAIARMRAALANIKDETVNIRVTRTGVSTADGGLGPVGSADGSFVPKTGLPYADRHHYLLADGEGITTNRHGETDRFRDVVSGINAGFSRSTIKGMLADGGIVGDDDRKDGKKKPKQLTPYWVPNMSAEMVAVIAEFGSLQRALRKSEGALSRETQERDDAASSLAATQQAFAELGAAVTAQFSGDPFAVREGYAGDPAWASGGRPASEGTSDPIKTLQEQIAYGMEQDRLQAQLEAAGLGGGTLAEQNALAEVLRTADNKAMQALLDGGQVQQLEDLLIQRASLIDSRSSAAGEAVYGEQLRYQTEELALQTAEAREANQKLNNLEHMAKVLEQIRDEAPDNAERSGSAAATGFVQGGNGTAKRRRRDRKR